MCFAIVDELPDGFECFDVGVFGNEDDDGQRNDEHEEVVVAESLDEMAVEHGMQAALQPTQWACKSC